MNSNTYKSKKQEYENKSSTNQTKQNRQPPKPERFIKYHLLDDETGFKIPNCDHIFLFDKYGGWHDEYNNYYDYEGNPCTAPGTDNEENNKDDYGEDEEGEEGFEDEKDENIEYDDNDNNDDYDDYGDEFAEKLVNEYDDYGGDDDYDDEDDIDANANGYNKSNNNHRNIKHYENYYSNIENSRRIQEAIPNSIIKIEVSNIGYQLSEKEFIDFISKESGVILKNYYVPLFDDNKKKHRGKVEIKVESKQDAFNLIKLNGKDLSGRKLKVLVFEQNLDEESSEEIIYNVPTQEKKTETPKILDHPPGLSSGVSTENPTNIINTIVQPQQDLPNKPIQVSLTQIQENVIKSQLGLLTGINAPTITVKTNSNPNLISNNSNNSGFVNIEKSTNNQKQKNIDKPTEVKQAEIKPIDTKSTEAKPLQQVGNNNKVEIKDSQKEETKETKDIQKKDTKSTTPAKTEEQQSKFDNFLGDTNKIATSASSSINTNSGADTDLGWAKLPNFKKNKTNEEKNIKKK